MVHSAGASNEPRALRLEIELVGDGVRHELTSVPVRLRLRNTGTRPIDVPSLALPTRHLFLRLETPENRASGRQGVVYDAGSPERGEPGPEALSEPSSAGAALESLAPGDALDVVVDLLDLGKPPPTGRWRLTAGWSWRDFDLRVETGLEILAAGVIEVRGLGNGLVAWRPDTAGGQAPIHALAFDRRLGHPGRSLPMPGDVEIVTGGVGGSLRTPGGSFMVTAGQGDGGAVLLIAAARDAGFRRRALDLDGGFIIPDAIGQSPRVQVPIIQGDRFRLAVVEENGWHWSEPVRLPDAPQEARVAWRGGYQLLLATEGADGDRFVQRYDYLPELRANGARQPLPAGPMAIAGGRVWIRTADGFEGFDGGGPPLNVAMPPGDWTLLDAREDGEQVALLLRAADDEVRLLRQPSSESAASAADTNCAADAPCRLVDRRSEPADRGYAAFLEDGRIFGATASGFGAPLVPGAASGAESDG